MGDVPYALALAAGLVAAFNPCGFALLPAYLTLLIASPEQDASRTAAVLRALRMTAAMTVGFVAVFGAFGLIVTPLALSVQEWLPWATIVIGVVLLVLGGWLLSGRELFFSGPKFRTGPPTRSV
ncbi:cytochrome c biogenesis protein CcdA [Yinghuangia sp. YIM S10712]|uniref:cytochrome c biogenesis protein CcdA n=1 Tax=Yinghuangia sp. YIM S10712 TaxID=3436930 RepID=UPI003F539642